MIHPRRITYYATYATFRLYVQPPMAPGLARLYTIAGAWSFNPALVFPEPEIVI